MAVDAKLLRTATNAPQSVWFDDLVALTKQFGWIEVGGDGSHTVFRHPEAAKIKDKYPRPLNLQRGYNGKAKVYQVKQLLEMAKAMNLIADEPKDKTK